MRRVAPFRPVLVGAANVCRRYKGTDETGESKQPSNDTGAQTPEKEPQQAAQATASASATEADAADDTADGKDSAAIEPKAAEGSSDVLVDESQRWEQDEPDHRVYDEKGEIVIKKKKWHTGDLAYQTPPPPGHLQARFGYDIVQVKKPQTYWQYYRQMPGFVSFRHFHILMWFAMGLVYLLCFLVKEIQHFQAQAMKPGQLTGAVRGKGAPPGKTTKIKTSIEEQNEFMQKLQSGYFNADELAYKGNKDYQMKKIPRPKEFKVQDYLRS